MSHQLIHPLMHICSLEEAIFLDKNGTKYTTKRGKGREGVYSIIFARKIQREKGRKRKEKGRRELNREREGRRRPRNRKRGKPSCCHRTPLLAVAIDPDFLSVSISILNLVEISFLTSKIVYGFWFKLQYGVVFKVQKQKF